MTKQDGTTTVAIANVEKSVFEAASLGFDLTLSKNQVAELAYMLRERIVAQASMTNAIAELSRIAGVAISADKNELPADTALELIAQGLNQLASFPGAGSTINTATDAAGAPPATTTTATPPATEPEQPITSDTSNVIAVDFRKKPRDNPPPLPPTPPRSA